jgi:MinD-like ATPase involved in chromosome partitioning or flagellar assembly
MGGRLWVSRFRRDRIRTGQQVHLLPTGADWAALRRHADLVVLDAPAADRSSACLTAAPFVDCSVLVVAADQPDTTAPAALRDALNDAGGRCAGVVFNRAEVEPAPFLRAAQP